MTILQLNPHICVDTPLGPGVALFIIDYAVHTNTCWVVAIEKLDWTIKHFDANDVKIHKNWTYHFGSMGFGGGEVSIKKTEAVEKK